MSDGKRVLLVDDDVDLVAMNRSVLEANGYEVVVAYDGEECLAKVAAEHPDVIILDIMMKTVGDGMFCAQHLRKDDATRHIPIIVLTSVNQVPPYNIGIDEGWLPVDVFIEKPASAEALLGHVRRALGVPEPHVERTSQ